MKLIEYIGSQFGNPQGIIGKICCVIMNAINQKMYTEVSDMVLKNSCIDILDVGFGNGYYIKNAKQIYTGLIFQKI